MKFKVGDKVEVYIENPNTYVKGCYESLNGLVGAIEKLRDMDNWTDKVFKDPQMINDAYLVRFEKPYKAWFTHQRPSDSFWFPECDLIRSYKGE